MKDLKNKISKYRTQSLISREHIIWYGDDLIIGLGDPEERHDKFYFNFGYVLFQVDVSSTKLKPY